MTSTQTQTQAPVLPASLRVGAVELTVSDLDRSVDFYESAIGLRLHRREDGRAALGAGGEDLVVLVEDAGARRAGRHAGLYHFALLHPSRLELARAAQRLAATRTRISGASDHGISEAIYLPDPDGTGSSSRPIAGGSTGAISPTRPRPAARSRSTSRACSRSSPTSEPVAHVAPETVVGHVHLHVGDIERGSHVVAGDRSALEADDSVRSGRARCAPAPPPSRPRRAAAGACRSARTHADRARRPRRRRSAAARGRRSRCGRRANRAGAPPAVRRPPARRRGGSRRRDRRSASRQIVPPGAQRRFGGAAARSNSAASTPQPCLRRSWELTTFQSSQS